MRPATGQSAENLEQEDRFALAEVKNAYEVRDALTT